MIPDNIFNKKSEVDKPIYSSDESISDETKILNFITKYPASTESNIIDNVGLSIMTTRTIIINLLKTNTIVINKGYYSINND